MVLNAAQKIKKYLTQSKDITKDSYKWNTFSSLLFGFQSVILLMILTRTVGIIESGVFTIAYANASLFLFIGKYGVRNYQVSDISMSHTFGDYRAARYISTIAMVLTAVGYIIYCTIANGYSSRKGLIIFFMCLFKVPDSIEDVYYGEYQHKGRLDIATKAMTIRLGLSIISFVTAIIMIRDLLFSLIISTVFSFIIMILLLRLTELSFDSDIKVRMSSVMVIFRDCFPLFAGTFLSQYISNAPKYAIDAQLSDELQAYYGFIAMPVFVIGLLSNVIFRPVIYKMAVYWNEGKKAKFIKRIFIQGGSVGIITLACIIGAYFLGTPVLSIMYNADLSNYRRQLLILLLGGGFLALSGLLNVIITIMRLQYALLWGYGAISALALLLSDRIVALYGFNGASWLYTGLMGGLFVIFFAIFLFGLLKNMYGNIAQYK